jgi:hypothetical protein
MTPMMIAVEQETTRAAGALPDLGGLGRPGYNVVLEAQLLREQLLIAPRRAPRLRTIVLMILLTLLLAGAGIAAVVVLR